MNTEKNGKAPSPMSPKERIAALKGGDVSLSSQALGVVEVGELNRLFVEVGKFSPDALESFKAQALERFPEDEVEKALPRREMSASSGGYGIYCAMQADRERNIIYIDKSTAKGEDIRVHGRYLAPTRILRSPEDTDYRIEFEFSSPVGWKRALTGRDAIQALKELQSAGYWWNVEKKSQAELLQYVNLCFLKPLPIVTAHHQGGWRGRSFITLSKSYGDENLCIEPKSVPPGKSLACEPKGSLEEWKEKVALLTIGNSRLTFALSCVFAAPLLHWIPEVQPGCFNIKGGSGLGKTTALKVAASALAGWGFEKESWNNTITYFERVLHSKNDSVLLMDELGEKSDYEIGQTAYLVGNCSSKGRCDSSAALREKFTSKLITLSTAEESLSEKMARAKLPLKDGQESRFVEVPACGAGSRFGLFEVCYGVPEGDPISRGRDFANLLARRSEEYSGTAFDGFMERLVSELEPDALRSRFTRLAAQFRGVSEGRSPTIDRVGARFALVALGGVIASEMDILPHSEQDIVDSCLACFGDWISERGGESSFEQNQKIRGFCELIQAHQFDVKFLFLGSANTQKFGGGTTEGEVQGVGQTFGDCYGYREESAEKTYLLLLGTTLKKWGINPRDGATLEELIRLNILIPSEETGQKRSQIAKKIEGKTKRLYRIDLESVEEFLCMQTLSLNSGNSGNSGNRKPQTYTR